MSASQTRGPLADVVKEQEIIKMAVNKNTPTVFTVYEVAKILRIGKISAYQAIDRGEVPSIRIGRRILVPRTALEEVLNRFSPSKPGANSLSTE